MRALLSTESKTRCAAFLSRQRLMKSFADRRKTVRFLTTAKPQQAGGAKATESSITNSWRENPNLKYWVIGVSLIGGVIFHYVYRDREKKRLIIKNLPAIPNHPISPRKREVSELRSLQSVLMRDNDVAVIQIVGPRGAGKTQLASLLAEDIAREEQAKLRILPRNHFTGCINASSLESLLLDVKRFCIAIGCKEDDWSSKSKGNSDFFNLGKQEQLHCFTEALKEKLRDNSGWVVIVDNPSEEVNLDEWLSDDINSNWGKGTFIITSSNALQNDSYKDGIYSLDKG